MKSRMKGPTELSVLEILTRLNYEIPEGVTNHSLRTAELARELAEIHGVDPDRAQIAALVHDVADVYSDRELLSLAEEFDLPVTLTEARVPKLLHAAVGAEVLHRDWGIDDDEILDAVRDHVTGGVRMSPLAKVLFVADKLEPERDHYYGGLNPIRELAKISLDQAILRLYAWRMGSLVSAEQPVDHRLVDARNRLIDHSLASRR